MSIVTCPEIHIKFGDCEVDGTVEDILNVRDRKEAAVRYASLRVAHAKAKAYALECKFMRNIVDAQIRGEILASITPTNKKTVADIEAEIYCHPKHAESEASYISAAEDAEILDSLASAVSLLCGALESAL